jgi:hypothetical protein
LLFLLVPFFYFKQRFSFFFLLLLLFVVLASFVSESGTSFVLPSAIYPSSWPFKSMLLHFFSFFFHFLMLFFCILIDACARKNKLFMIFLKKSEC